MPQYVIMHPENDNVATATVDLPEGTALEVNGQVLTLVQEIRFGHKFAVRAIQQGESVIKYGQVIGTAVHPIAPGEHAHVHNIESNRGRGDKVHANS